MGAHLPKGKALMATRAKVKICEAIIDTFTVAASKTATLGKRVRFAAADDQIQDCVLGEDGIGIAMSSAGAGSQVGVLLDGHAIAKVLVGTGGASRGKHAVMITDGFTDLVNANPTEVQYPAGKFMQTGVVGDYVGLLIQGGEAGRSPYAMNHVRARNVVLGNVADLTAYVVASDAALNDAVLNVEGDIVLLCKQTTAAQDGLYRVGVVASGLAPLTRLLSLPTGAILKVGSVLVEVAEGSIFNNTQWKNTAAGTVGTNDPLFMPGRVTIAQALVAGAITLTSIPVLSATKTGVEIRRSTANTCAATDGGYVLNGNPTAGKLGTASIPIMASVLAGTLNNADISTVHVTVINF